MGLVSVASSVGLLDATTATAAPVVARRRARARDCRLNTRASRPSWPTPRAGGTRDVRVDWRERRRCRSRSARPLATGIHQVDNPVFDRRGRLYVTVSGARGQQVAVSIFRVDAGGAREPFSSGIVNATSMAIGPDGALYVTEPVRGHGVPRYRTEGEATPFVTEARRAVRAGVRRRTARCSSAIGRARCSASRAGRAAMPCSPRCPRAWRRTTWRSAPTAGSMSSVPTLVVMRSGSTASSPATAASRCCTRGFGRPQGLAFDAAGSLHVVEALAGRAACTASRAAATRVLVARARGSSASRSIPNGALVVASNDTVYGFARFAAASATAH